MSHACAFQTTGRGHATRTRSTCFVRELRHPNLPQQKARRLAPSAPVPAVQRLGPHLDGPGTQGVPISHRVAPIPPEQGRLSGAQPAAPAPRAPCPGQVLGPRLGTTGTPGRRHMPRACPASPGGSAQRPPREAREPSCGLFLELPPESSGDYSCRGCLLLGKGDKTGGARPTGRRFPC